MNCRLTEAEENEIKDYLKINRSAPLDRIITKFEKKFNISITENCMGRLMIEMEFGL
jgi:uncharacterized protein YlxP (DUF503 family)